MLKNHHMNGLLCLCLMLAQTYYKNKKCPFLFFSFFWYTCSRQYFHIFMSLLYGLGQKGICSKTYTNLTFPKKLFLLTTKNMVYLTAYDFSSPCSKHCSFSDLILCYFHCRLQEIKIEVSNSEFSVLS